MRQPTLDDIRRVGQDKYNDWLSMFCFDSASMADRIKERAAGLEGEAAGALAQLLSELDLSQYSAFDILTSDSNGFRRMTEGLSFFIKGEVVPQVKKREFAIMDGGEVVGSINAQNYDEVSNAVRSFSLPNGDGETNGELKFSSENARKVYERCEAGRKKAKRKREQNSNNESFELGNIISAIATQHNSLNLLNIWGLTPYQLYNQFARVDRKTQLDVIGLKWAAWGSEPFEFDTWRTTMNKGD